MGRLQKHYLLVLFLLAAHLLYAPAWEAGWVRDVSGWLQAIHTKSFGDYLLRRGLHVESLYPFTQGMLWLWWKLFGVHPLPWHLLMVSLHALCAWGWMLFYNRVFRKPAVGLFAGFFVLLSPYATEVVVWVAGYHYLQGTLLTLATLFALLHYLDSGKKRWLALGLLAFVPSLFALEIFYLTPVYVAVVLLYFRKHPLARYAMRGLLLPMLALCAGQYLLFRLFYSHGIPHIQALHPEWVGDYLRKPAKYLFNGFLFGRYWPERMQQLAYQALNSRVFLLTFYPLLLILLFYFRKRLKQLPERPLVVPAGFGLAALILVIPLHFHEEGLVYFDRYSYCLVPAIGALLGFLIRSKIVRAALLTVSAGLLFHTVWLWRQSAVRSREMLQAIPDFKDGRPTILLNVPNALKGIPMIGQTQEGEAALIRRYVLQKPFSGKVLEPSAGNLQSLTDSVTVQWQDAQTLRVTQLSGGGWWTGGIPSTDWANDLFSVHFLPQTKSYELHFFQPAAKYHLLVWRTHRWTELQRF